VEAEEFAVSEEARGIGNFVTELREQREELVAEAADCGEEELEATMKKANNVDSCIIKLGCRRRELDEGESIIFFSR
jgi:hypothetical protein